VEYKALGGLYLGLNSHNMCWLATKKGAKTTYPVNELCATTIHELGHAVGLVPNAQDTYYASNSYLGKFQKSRGGHCAYPIKNLAHRKAGMLRSLQKKKLEEARGECVMWGVGQEGKEPSSFCPSCADTLKALTMRIEPIPADWSD
jgi:hypothetical protein